MVVWLEVAVAAEIFFEGAVAGCVIVGNCTDYYIDSFQADCTDSFQADYTDFFQVDCIGFDQVAYTGFFQVDYTDPFRFDCTDSCHFHHIDLSSCPRKTLFQSTWAAHSHYFSYTYNHYFDNCPVDKGLCKTGCCFGCCFEGSYYNFDTNSSQDLYITISTFALLGLSVWQI